MRNRGRPRNNSSADLAKKDEVIARTVHQLTLWGFPQKRRVFELVGRSAAKILGRTDSNCLGLGADRIKQIYQLWHRKQPLRYQRWRYAKISLQERIPDKTKTLEQLAQVLLSNEGIFPESPGDVFVPYGDAQLTPKASREYLRSRITWAGKWSIG